MRKKLSNLMLGETSEETPEEKSPTATQEEEGEEEAPPDSQLPEPPVVVNVKPSS